MEARVTPISAKQAWVDGTEIAKLRKELREKDAMLEELSMELTKTKTQLRMCRSVIQRHNQTLVLKYKGMREAKDFEEKELRGERIDCLIIGAMLGVMAVMAVCWWILTM